MSIWLFIGLVLSFLLGTILGSIFVRHDYEDYRILKKLNSALEQQVNNLTKLLSLKEEECTTLQEDLHDVYAEIDQYVNNKKEK